MPLTDPEYRALTRRITLDMILDTAGNLMLGIGLYLAFSEAARNWPAWMQEPAVKAALIATGVLNLRLLPARFRRLRTWREARDERRDG